MTTNVLGFLENFRIIKLNTKKNKLQVQFEVGTSGNKEASVSTKKKKIAEKGTKGKSKEENEKEEKSDAIINKVNRKQNGLNREIDNAVLQYSQDIVDKVLYNLRNDLKQELDESKLEQLVNNTKLLVNQFQNLAYTRALFAQQGMKRM